MALHFQRRPGEAVKQKYTSINLSSGKLDFIDAINPIVDEYIDAGLRLSVRQLYYQLVARGIVENTVQSYKRVASIISDGKMVGLIDWDAIEDRTREFSRKQRFTSTRNILEVAGNAFHLDQWVGQEHRCFVVVEKEALSGVLEPICREYDAPLLAARGYPSGSVLREFAESDLIPCFDFKDDGKGFLRPGPKQQRPVIIHLGDHDPSGIDMSRDLMERFSTFILGATGRPIHSLLVRVALNMEQVEEQQPPPNPAKTTDARFADYEKKFGTESWELDALKPDYLVRLVRDKVREFIDKPVWDARKRVIERGRTAIQQFAATFTGED